MFQKIRDKSEGFTIIEVMIVLAIGALILVVVMIAIPQLQRNQRNSARRDVLGRIKAELDNYAGNNNGNYPAANMTAGTRNLGTPATTGFFNRYLGCTGATTCSVNINDPSTGTPMTPTQTANNPGTPTLPTGNGNIGYYTQAVCDGETPVNTGASARNYAIVTQLEGGAYFCMDNR